MFLLLLLLPTMVLAQCPPVNFPCVCIPSFEEPISLVCEDSQSLEDVAGAIASARDLLIDRLMISGFSMEELPNDNPIRAFRVRKLGLNQLQMWKLGNESLDGPLLDSIEELNLRDNKFGEVPTQGAPKLRNLKRLILNNNRINSIPPDAFGGYANLEKLEKLDLSKNYIGDLPRTSPFREMVNLRDLSLEHNYIQNFPVSSLAALASSLEDLNLGSNNISYLPTDTLNLPKLLSLSLEYNSLTNINPSSLRGFPNLLHLYLTGGYNSKILDPEMFRYTPKLRVLSIGESPIEAIPVQAFKYTPELIKLDMSESALSTIAPGAFHKAPKLQAITLHKCLISKIPRGVFSDLDSLYSLDLSGNVIEDVEDFALAGLSSLKHIDLSSNRITSLPPHTMGASTNFGGQHASLYLCDNPWKCDSNLLWLSEWLRKDHEIIIDKLPCTTTCAEPSLVESFPLRTFPDVLVPITESGPETPPAITVIVTAPPTDFRTTRRPFNNGMSLMEQLIQSVRRLVLELTNRYEEN